VVDWCVVERFMIDIFLIGTFLFDRCKIDGFNGGWFMNIIPLIVSWVVDWCVVERFMIDFFFIG
jgi:hypothetical protein